ncbi:hypothetical protein O1L44_18550 [Streptomyces noursei]|nr:hypothetical protein [Streptomyces noursei]
MALAASAGAAGVLAAGAPGLWTVLTALLLAVVLFSRARAYPLAAEVIALLAAGTAVCVRLVLLCATDGGARRSRSPRWACWSPCRWRRSPSGCRNRCGTGCGAGWIWWSRSAWWR